MGGRFWKRTQTSSPSFPSDVSLQDQAPNASFVAFLEESFQGFEEFLTLRDVESLVPAPDLRKVQFSLARCRQNPGGEEGAVLYPPLAPGRGWNV